MSDETLNSAYNVADRRIFNLQLELCIAPSSIIQSEIDALERFQSRILENLYVLPLN
jgi:hypothetical protein